MQNHGMPRNGTNCQTGPSYSIRTTVTAASPTWKAVKGASPAYSYSISVSNMMHSLQWDPASAWAQFCKRQSRGGRLDLLGMDSHSECESMPSRSSRPPEPQVQWPAARNVKLPCHSSQLQATEMPSACKCRSSNSATEASFAATQAGTAKGSTGFKSKPK